MQNETSKTAAARRAAYVKAPLLDEPSLLKALQSNGIKPQHADRMWRAVTQLNATDIRRDVSDLPSLAYSIVEEKFEICSSRLVEILDSPDGSTTKMIIELSDKHRIEAVIMRYGAVPMASFPPGEAQSPKTDSSSSPNNRRFRSNPRATLCVACQVGCQMGCSFCATGTMGLRASLTSGEILEQLFHANCLERRRNGNEEGIRNVVFMGMGEPLDNYTEVVTAIWGMVDVKRFGIAAHRVSISTVGVINRIKQLSNDVPGCTLALSLHAPNQELRQRLIPSATAWHLDRILEATDYFVEQQKLKSRSSMRRQALLVEYIMLKGINILEEHAHQLGELMKPRADSVLVNLIPYNPTLTPSSDIYEAPTQEEVDAFVAIVRSYGVKVTVRQTLGQEIGGACGQLLAAESMYAPNELLFSEEKEQRFTKMKHGIAIGLTVAAATTFLVLWRRRRAR